MVQKIECYEQGCGETLTLIHGWGMSAAVFEPLVECLSAHFRVMRVDLPGYGGSDWIDRADFDEQFDAQVDALSRVLPESVLVGWSMGGLYALRLAQRYPQRFHKLILLSCNPCFVQRDDWPCAVPASVFSEFSDALGKDRGATIRRFLGLQMRGSEQARQLTRLISGLLLDAGEPNPAALRFGLDLLLRHDARAELGALEQPVMSILGERDMLVPAALAQQLHRVNSSIRVECLPRSAHAPFLSHPDKVADLISEFIKPTQTGQGGG